MWRVKCLIPSGVLLSRTSYGLRDLPKKEGTWREQYLGKKIPLNEDGDRIGYLYYNYQTGLIFPAAETLIILINGRTPYLQILDGSHASEVFTDMTLPLDRIDRAIFFRGIPLQHTIWSNKEFLEQQIYEQMVSWRGTPPIYGYPWATWEQGHEKPVQYFTLIDRRSGCEKRVEFFALMDGRYVSRNNLDSILEALKLEPTGDKTRAIIAELKRIGHILCGVFI